MILGLVGLACAVWVISDVWMVNRRLSPEMKLLWTVLALVFSILSAVVYYVVYKKR